MNNYGFFIFITKSNFYEKYIFTVAFKLNDDFLWTK